jgi:hypothetical protein
MIVIGHQDVSGYRSERTLAAHELAIELAIELGTDRQTLKSRSRRIRRDRRATPPAQQSSSRTAGQR